MNHERIVRVMVNKKLAVDPENYNFSRYYYAYYKKDATEPVDKSIQVDLKTVDIRDIQISRDGKKVSLSLSDLKPGYIYELGLKNMKSASGKPLENELICYTLNHLKSAAL